MINKGKLKILQEAIELEKKHPTNIKDLKAAYHHEVDDFTFFNEPGLEYRYFKLKEKYLNNKESDE